MITSLWHQSKAILFQSIIGKALPEFVKLVIPCILPLVTNTFLFGSNETPFSLKTFWAIASLNSGNPPERGAHPIAALADEQNVSVLSTSVAAGENRMHMSGILIVLTFKDFCLLIIMKVAK